MLGRLFFGTLLVDSCNGVKLLRWPVVVWLSCSNQQQRQRLRHVGSFFHQTKFDAFFCGLFLRQSSLDRGYNGRKFYAKLYTYVVQSSACLLAREKKRKEDILFWVVAFLFVLCFLILFLFFEGFTFDLRLVFCLLPFRLTELIKLARPKAESFCQSVCQSVSQSVSQSSSGWDTHLGWAFFFATASALHYYHVRTTSISGFRQVSQRVMIKVCS